MKKYVHLVLSILTASSLFSQEQPQVTFHNPEVSGLGKYGDHPVSLSTGVPSTNIPIFSLQEGELTENISLSYHGGGIRVTEKASWVGLGWSLKAGGYIARSVIGAEDESGHGFYNGSFWYSPRLHERGWLAADPHYPFGVVDGTYDKEPDIFSFSFAGKSGKFIFDRYGMPHLLPNQDLEITVVGNLDEFIITDENGTKYYFGENDRYETQRQQYYDLLCTGATSDLLMQTHKTVWYLTKIESASAEDIIYFNYVPNTENYLDILGESKTSGWFCQDPNRSPRIAPRCFGQTFVEGFVLSSILTKQHRVDFNSFPNRQDIEGAVKLSNIQIKHIDNNALIKKVEFQTDYFDCPNLGSVASEHSRTYSQNSYDTKRLKLNAVKQYNGPHDAGTHRFTYFEGVPLPRRLSFAQDTKGFYNGRPNNKTLLPKIPELEGCPIYPSLADRSASWPESKAFILERIDYPTNGYTEFVYEPNSQPQPVFSNGIIYWDEIIVNEVGLGTTGDMCDYSGIHRPSITSPSLVKGAGNVYFGINASKCSYNINDEEDVSITPYEKIEVTISNVTTGTSYQREFDTDGYGNLYVDDEPINIPEGDEFRITATVSAYSTYPLDIHASVQVYGLSSELTEVEVPGLRIQSQLIYDGSQPRTITYDYHLSKVQVGYTPVFLSQYRGFGDDPVAYCDPFPHPIQRLASSPNSGLMNIGGDYLAYQKVSEIEQGNGYTTTEFFFNDEQLWIHSGISELYQFYSSDDGYMTKQETYNEQGEKVRTIEKQITAMQGEQVLEAGDALRIYLVGRTSAGCPPVQGGYTVDPFISANEYTLFNQWIGAERITETAHDASGDVVKQSEVLKNSEFHDFPTETFSYDSKGNKLISRTIYTSDIRIDACDQTLAATLANIKSQYPSNQSSCDDNQHTDQCYRTAFDQKRVDILAAYSEYDNCTSAAFGQAGSQMQIVKKMQDRNIIRPVETMKLIAYKSGANSWGTEKVLSTQYFEYEETDGNIHLECIYEVPFLEPLNISSFTQLRVQNSGGYSIVNDSRYESEIWYKYNNSRLVEVKKEADIPTSYIWSYDNQHPVAEIIGKSIDEVKQVLGNTFINNLTNETDQSNISSQLNTLRNNPGLSTCLIRTFLYKNGIGLSETRDENDYRVKYEYDPLGRLHLVKDQDENVLKQYEYNYGN